MLGRHDENHKPTRRKIPFFYLLRLYLSVGVQAGWFFLGAGLIAVYSTAFQSGLVDLWEFRGELSYAQGSVIQSMANAKAGEETSYAIEFRFLVAGGEEFTGVCHKTAWHPDAGDVVEIEYVRLDPSVSRIRGTRRARLPAAVGIFLLVFPAVGLSLIVWKTVVGRRRHLLLTRGVMTKGSFVSCGVGTEDSGHRYHRLTYKFFDEHGESYLTEFESKKKEVGVSRASRILLYDRLRPSRNVVLASLPGQVEKGAGDEIRCVNHFGPMPLVIPIIVIVTNVEALKSYIG